MITDDIREQLFALRDEKYAAFQAKLIPNIPGEKIIGVRVPEIRKLGKTLMKAPDIGIFLDDLPHKYYDEDVLHGFIISQIKDYNECMERFEKFLPYIDNWAVCDLPSPKVFAKNLPDVYERVKVWLCSERTYTVRFGLGILMRCFLDEEFTIESAELAAQVRSEEYYISMMQAWYFATALAKQYDHIIPYIENRRLDTVTHNRTIQKAVESYRITDEQKAYLKTLRIRKSRKEDK